MVNIFPAFAAHPRRAPEARPDGSQQPVITCANGKAVPLPRDRGATLAAIVQIFTVATQADVTR
jgi:hypothetical protein